MLVVLFLTILPSSLLSVRLLDAADRSQPLPVLPSRISDLLDQAAARHERARDAASPTSPWTPLESTITAKMLYSWLDRSDAGGELHRGA